MTDLEHVQPPQPAAWSPERVELLKRTIATDLNDDELAVFLAVAQRTGLDPFARQIYGVVRKGRLTIQVGIDGLRLIAERSGGYAGNDEPVFAEDDGAPFKASVTVWKLVAGQLRPFTASAYWDEYYPGDGDAGFMWRKMPHVMLGKVAEALALRKAFPADLSGLVTDDEMAQADRAPIPRGPFDDWPGGKAEHDARFQAVRARARALSDEDQERLRSLLDELGVGRPPYSPAAMESYEGAVDAFEPVDADIVEGSSP